MNLRLVTVALDPESGTFPEDPLAGLDGEVVSVVEHFFHHAGLPHLLLVVHVRQPAVRSGEHRRPGAGAVRSEDDARQQLDAEARVLYERLVAWRIASATAEGVPPYVVATNRQLAQVAQVRPRSLTALRTIAGFGDAKVRKYGETLVALIATDLPRESAPLEATRSDG